MGRRRFVDHGRRIVGIPVALGLLFTVVISVAPGVKLAYLSRETHVAIESLAFVIPALAAVLFGGRALRSHSSTDLLVCASLVLLGATNLFFAVIPAVADEDPGEFATWAPAAGRILGAAGFALAALLPAKQLADARRALTDTLVASAAVIGLIAILGGLFASELPQGVDPALSPDAANRPLIVGHWLVLTLQVGTLLLYAVATGGFLRRAERERDAMLVWLALAAGLSGLARLNYFLFPSLYSEWVYLGDFFKLVGYLALLVGVGRELLAYQRGAADAAVFEERRRLARELHDGLAQELAFIRSEGARLSGTSDRGVMRMATAAERALGEARMAISSLTTPVGEPLATTLGRAAENVAGRMGARVEIASSGKAEVPTASRQALERIVREATWNAVRHGQAKLVEIRIDAEGDVKLSVVDNGRGFDPRADRRNESFGLTSMRERAEAMEGTFEVRSSPGEGTTVQVVIPNSQPKPPRAPRS